MKDTNWNLIYDEKCDNTATDLLNSMLKNIIQEATKAQKSKNSPKEPWISKYFLKLINEKENLHKT